MKRLSKLFLENLHLKLLAVIFALLFWFLATNKEIAETTIKLRVEPIITGDYRVVDYRPKELTFVIEGYRRDLNRLKELTKVSFKLPPELGRKSGWVKVKLKREDFYFGLSVKVKKIEPSEIEVKVEKLVRVAVPIVLKFKGLPVGALIELHPNYAVLSLPEELKGVPITVETEEVDLKGVKLPVELVVPLSSRFQPEPKKVKVVIKKGGDR
ncbi:hypothetical protein [Thermovibrio sp.]